MLGVKYLLNLIRMLHDTVVKRNLLNIITKYNNIVKFFSLKSYTVLYTLHSVSFPSYYLDIIQFHGGSKILYALAGSTSSSILSGNDVKTRN